MFEQEGGRVRHRDGKIIVVSTLPISLAVA